MAARRVEGLQFERVADEILVVKPGTLEAHALNQSAAAVFDLCDGKASKSDMAAAIQRRTGLPADEEIVDLALAELVDAGVIVLDGPESPSTISRRSLVRRLSLSAAAVMMLPVVETILMPPAAAQASPTTTTTSSTTSTTSSTSSTEPTTSTSSTSTSSTTSSSTSSSTTTSTTSSTTSTTKAPTPTPTPMKAPSPTPTIL
jgi:hypothetical protein